MKVTLLNKSDEKGGAAIACSRLARALSKKKINVNMLVDIKDSTNKNTIALSNSKFSKLISHYKFLFEKIIFMLYEKSKEERFSFSTAILGNSICKNQHIIDADIIHIHWTNHSFLSLKNLQDLNSLNKPIVVTMHDMWFATGGCHHSRTCTNYTIGCGNCMFLKNPKDLDISAKQFISKQKIYDSNITFVGCSKWLTNLANKSALMQNSKVINIPNPIDVSLFSPVDKKEAKQKLKLDPNKKHILFAASNVTNPRKGFKYLEKSIEILKEQNIDNYVIMVLGNDKYNEINFSIPTIMLGYMTDNEKIAEIYNAADIFVSPTLEDNLPNTIMESMSCETPCVAFDVGGISDLIDHKQNGYLARYLDSSDLAEGIQWTISNIELRKNAREKVINTFSEEIVANKFIKLYKELL